MSQNILKIKTNSVIGGLTFTFVRVSHSYCERLLGRWRSFKANGKLHAWKHKLKHPKRVSTEKLGMFRSVLLRLTVGILILQMYYSWRMSRTTDCFGPELSWACGGGMKWKTKLRWWEEKSTASGSLFTCAALRPHNTLGKSPRTYRVTLVVVVNVCGDLGKKRHPEKYFWNNSTYGVSSLTANLKN